jgi:hypothetical protein
LLKILEELPVILRLGVLLSLIALLGLSSCPPPAGTIPGGPGTSIAPMITQQPASQTATVGQTATFTVMATGTAPLSYQWEKNNSAIMNAPNSPSYTTPTLAMSDSGATFQVIVSNGVNPSATSNPATLTVNPASVAPTITTQPSNATVTAGATATFTVVATGTAPLSYQWQRNNSPIANAPNSPSYTTATLSTADSGATFRVVVSNGVNPPATSTSATLTVNPAAVAPSITTQPVNTTVTAGQTATFTVVASGTPAPTYQWQTVANNTGTNVAGATSASYAIASTTTGQSGMQLQVVVSNSAGSVTSNVVTLTVNPATQPPPSGVAVLTYHNDVARTGQNLNETTLTTGNVNSSTFGLLGTIPVDGLVDAEPLYVGGMTISGGTHNVLFVATENDSVYAFDADTFTLLWHNALLSGTGESPSGDHGCGQVEPTIGITSTPVIDPTAGPHGTIFVVAMSISGGTYHQRLHALDLTTGNEQANSPVLISATFPNQGGTTSFDPGQYEERTGLLLLNNVIYLAWTSHCDGTPYTGWVLGYGETSLQQTSVVDVTPNGSEGGIWMAGDGLAADSSGNIYFLDGNGTFDTTLTNGLPDNADYGNGFIKLSTTTNTLAVADYFNMFDTVNQSNHDADLGSGGVLVLPDLVDGNKKTWHLAVGAGKPDANTGQTVIYVVNRDSMGKFNPVSDTGIYQEFAPGITGEIKSTPAYFNGAVYYGAVGDSLKAFQITNAMLGTSPSSHSPTTFGYPGTTPSISANGTTNGIVWAIQNGSTGTLHAYDATNLASELYNSNQAANGRDQFSTNSNCKFVTPLIANGKVYVGTPEAVVVFGLLGP